VIQALIARHYLHGGFYPVGGAWRIADTIIPRIRSTGGEVFTYARVKEVLVRDGRACGVRMEDGHEIESRCVISDAGAINTFARLLPREVAQAAGYDALLPKVKPSIGHLGVYIGLQATAAELGLPKTNYWIYPNNDYDGTLAKFEADPTGPFPVVYLSFPSAKDPDFERRHPGRATIEIVAPAPTRSSSPGRAGPGASAATTTRRSRSPTASACSSTCTRRCRRCAAASTTGRSRRRSRCSGSAGGSAANSTASTTTRPACSSAGCGRAPRCRACGSPGRTSCRAASPAR